MVSYYEGITNNIKSLSAGFELRSHCWDE